MSVKIQDGCRDCLLNSSLVGTSQKQKCQRSEYGKKHLRPYRTAPDRQALRTRLCTRQELLQKSDGCCGRQFALRCSVFARGTESNCGRMRLPCGVGWRDEHRQGRWGNWPCCLRVGGRSETGACAVVTLPPRGQFAGADGQELMVERVFKRSSLRIRIVPKPG